MVIKIPPWIDLAGIRICQALKRGWNVIGLKWFLFFAVDGNDGLVELKPLFDFDTHMILGIIKTPALGKRAAPMFADDRQEDAAIFDIRFDDLTKISGTGYGINIEKDRFLSVVIDQPII